MGIITPSVLPAPAVGAVVAEGSCGAEGADEAEGADDEGSCGAEGADESEGADTSINEMRSIKSADTEEISDILDGTGKSTGETEDVEDDA
jgi:hypothetical protein